MIGKGFAEIGRTLDWGCGCARVLRYIAQNASPVEGADVDETNVAWCQSNLPSVPVSQIPLLPPTHYPDNSFDLVFGISVLTHLRESAQDAWLRELSRIIRPGGHAALSVMGTVTQVITNLEEKKMQMTEKRGHFITDEVNDQIRMGGEEYYVNVTHAPWYILDHWPKASPFEIVDIAPALLAAQDIALLRNAK
jgi:2-polyprenyl-3-methyl-5-hydroxy-6-metoxy-1,4-benzoquinol methylase